MNYYRICKRLAAVTKPVVLSSFKNNDLAGLLNVLRKLDRLLVASVGRPGYRQGGERKALNAACAGLIQACRPLASWRDQALTAREFVRIIRRLEQAWWKYEEESTLLSKEIQP